MSELLFELIAVALQRREGLSREPTEKEWQWLYHTAARQALTGVCFAAVQQLKTQGMPIPKPIFMRWLSAAIKIQRLNEAMNRWTTELCQSIQADNIPCCVLKGQAVAALYDEPLRLLRQSGDIDVWMMTNHRHVIDWGNRHGGIWYFDYHHADLSDFHDTDVELHYRPTLSRNLLRNARLQRWFRKEREALAVSQEQTGFPVPRPDFNLILTLNHNFFHLLYEGVGLRQMMDLYYVLRHGMTEEDRENAKQLVRRFSLQRFCSASMWVLQKVFGLERQYMLYEPDEAAGRFLLSEIMKAGNFGQFDKRLKHGRYSNRLKLMISWLKHTSRLFRYYPADVLWTPFGILYISHWRRISSLKWRV